MYQKIITVSINFSRRAYFPAQFMCAIVNRVLKASKFTCQIHYQFKTDERGVIYYPHTTFILDFEDGKDL